MTKKSPIQEVSKQQPHKTTALSKKTVASTHKNVSSHRGVQKKKTTKKSSYKSSCNKTKASFRKTSYREFPSWLRIILQGGVVVAFIVGFYFFFIRPYAYRWKPCYGCREYGVCIPSGYEVHGMDISHYQGEIDWQAVSRYASEISPLKFVFIKATEGGDMADDKFAANYESAKANGYICGAYHFYVPATPALKQAEFFINTAQLTKGDLPPVLDIEKTGGKDIDELRKDLKIWLDRVEKHYGIKPVLYTSYKFKTKYLNDSVFNSYPYWIAHYYVDSVEYKGQWRFWQHTDVGNVPGIPESVDLNVFNGTSEELVKMTIP